MVHIRKTKTFTGELRYSVVALHTAITHDENKKVVKREEYLPLEYKQGKDVLPAVFPYTEEGLEKAKEIQNLYINS